MVSTYSRSISFLSELYDQLGSLLEAQPLDLWHADDSPKILSAISRLNNPAIRSQLGNGTKYQRYSLEEHARWVLDQ